MNEDKFQAVLTQIILPYMKKYGQLDRGIFSESDGFSEDEIGEAFNTMLEQGMLAAGAEPDIYVLNNSGNEKAPAPPAPQEYGQDDDLIKLMIFKTFIFYRQNPIKSTSIEMMKYKPGFEFLSKGGNDNIEKLEQHLQIVLKELHDKNIISVEEGDKSMVDLNAPTIPDIITLLDESCIPGSLKAEYAQIKPLMEKERTLLERLSIFNQEPYQRERNRIFMGRDTASFSERLDTLILKYNKIEDELESKKQREQEFLNALPDSLKEEYQEKVEHCNKTFERENLDEKFKELHEKFTVKAEEIREKERNKELKKQKKTAPGNGGKTAKKRSLLYKITHIFSRKK
ncbi:MAG: hypothetical protein JXR78_12370 [Victivallales bacterium]|nr:hypothetical protein [Victivallales bacterium]